MKKFLLPVIALFTTVACLQAQTPVFTPGNLAVVRLSGNDSSSGNGAAIFVDQYATNGTLASSFSVPTNGANALSVVGLAYEGYISLTPDGGRLVLPGYNIALSASTAQLNFTSSTTAPRAIATIDAYGNYSLPIVNSTVFSGYSIAGGASDGTNYWMVANGPPGEFATGQYPEVVYLGTAAGGTTIQVATNLFTTGQRNLNVFNVAGSNGLYACGYSATNYGYNTTGFGSGGFLLSNISGALPTSATGSTNLFPDGSSSTGTGSDLAINPAGTIAYLADASFGIVKFTNSGAGWVSNYIVVPTNAGYATAAGSKEAISVTADWTQNPPVVYATTAETYTNRLIRFSDTGSKPTIINLAFGSITAGVVTNALRGVRFVPVPLPVITVPPVAFTGNPGSTATFTATVIGSPTPTYQYYSNSVANPTYVPIPGATSTTLTLNNITLAQNGTMIYLVASNIYGVVSSAPVTLTVQDPAIVTGLMGATNFIGGSSVTLSVTAVGSGTLTYQYLSNGVPIAGATSPTYIVPSSSVSNSAAYSVVVYNGSGHSITNGPVIVSFTPYLLYDTFSYPNGNLFGDTGSPWTDINGSNPELVINGRVQVAQTNATTDGQSKFIQGVSGTVVWSSFIMNLTTLPTNAGGVYFANFEDTNFGFYGRIFTLTSNKSTYTPDISSVAYPGTYRVGIANAQTDSSGLATNGPSAVVELDMAPGIDYEVVASYDMSSGISQLAVNPSQTESNQVVSSDGVYNGTGNSPSPLTSGPALDRFIPSALPMAAYGLRQRQGEGIFQLDNLEVSYDYSAPFSGYAAVTAGFTPTLANIGFITPGLTNFTGNSSVLEVAASGIDLTYAWYQNGVQLSDGYSLSGSATAALTINPTVGSNSGNYTVVISNAAGSVTSSIVPVVINTTITAPVFTLQPVSTTAAEGSSVTFTSSATGTGPITYSYNYNGSSLGTSGSTLTLTGISTNQAGLYSVTATGGTGLSTTSSNAVLTVTGPVTTNIHYLRTLISLSSFTPTDTTTLYTIQGVVTTATNLTSGNTASYYVQDSTGGINLFITGDSTFRPALGDIVTATGLLSAFDENLELDVTAGASFQTYSDLGAGTLPSPVILPFNYTTTNLNSTETNIEGSLVTLTNVYFTTPGIAFTNATTTYPVTNNAGLGYTVYVSAQDTNFDGQLVPAFASTVTGVLDQVNSVFEITVTRYSDIVVGSTPTGIAVKASYSASQLTLSFPAVTSYTYSVLASTNVAGPYTRIVSGLSFSTTNGTYTVGSATNAAMFYQIVSP